MVFVALLEREASEGAERDTNKTWPLEEHDSDVPPLPASSCVNDAALVRSPARASPCLESGSPPPLLKDAEVMGSSQPFPSLQEEDGASV